MAKTTSKKSSEQELLMLEKRYWQAMKDHDTAAALRLTDDPCLVTGPQGVGRMDKKALELAMADPKWQLRDFQVDGAEVRLLTDDVAIVAYKVHEDVMLDGEPVTIDAAEASTWVRRKGSWVCALHCESIRGDPYGRDRKQEAVDAEGAPF
jgi:hypothetical protein